jgi:hypothetical protein
MAKRVGRIIHTSFAGMGTFVMLIMQACRASHKEKPWPGRFGFGTVGQVESLPASEISLLGRRCFCQTSLLIARLAVSRDLPRETAKQASMTPVIQNVAPWTPNPS